LRVVYLDSALQDLVWWRRYYGSVFPEGRPNARTRIRKVVAALEANPHLGRPTDEADVLEFVIARTPFSLLYRVKDDVIEILRLWDNRQKPRAGVDALR
jgi:plasmid stabilization system protein ParE